MPQYAGLYVTMNRNGDIVMSRVTWERLGAAEADRTRMKRIRRVSTDMQKVFSDL